MRTLPSTRANGLSAVSARLWKWGTLVALLTSSTTGLAAPPRDRTPPTTPRNLRVTQTGSYSVSLAWQPASDASSFAYRVRHSWGYETTLPSSQTSFTWTEQLEARGSYAFFVYAVDAAGNRSRSSNTVHVTLPRDTSPPTEPAVTVTDIGVTHVSFNWHSDDDGPWVWYTLFQDGVPRQSLTASEIGTAYLLEPETTYTFTVQARDYGANLSPLSDPIVVTTLAANPDDVTPPTVPTGLVWDVFDNEISLRWTASTDDHDPQNLLRYDVAVNGVVDDITVGGRTQTIVYGVNGQNLVTVEAVDTAGNRSAAASAMIPVEF
jgi:large repetitive protein